MSDFALNKNARKNYIILDTLEAGLALIVNEPSLIRGGKIQISSSYAKIFYNQKSIPEVWLIGSIFGLSEQNRSIKLLLKRQEINKLIGQVAADNKTLVPLKLYGRKGKIKLELAVARGKLHKDRREEIKKRDLNREIQREIKYER